jgi:uncharacterized protein YndB with AHSA1/START domain
MTVTFTVRLKIRKPPAEVFAAVVDPAALSRYFIESASGPMVAGTTLMWKFAEAPVAFPVRIVEVSEDARIVIEWTAAAGHDTRAEIDFEALNANETMVLVTESGWPADETGLAASHANAGGWMHMLSCLKAWLEYGINLREGGAV